MFCSMCVVFWCSSFLKGRCYVVLQLRDFMEIVLFVASIYYMVCCLIDSIDISRFDNFLLILYLSFVLISL